MPQFDKSCFLLLNRLKEDLEEKSMRYETVILERDTYQKEVDCLKHQNTDDLYLPQIKEVSLNRYYVKQMF